MSRIDHPTRSTKTFRIKLCPLPLAERLAFVDRACTLMSEGRFGEVRMSRLFMGESRRHEISSGIFLDLEDDKWLSSNLSAALLDPLSPLDLSLGLDPTARERSTLAVLRDPIARSYSIDLKRTSPLPIGALARGSSP